jgi:outer membrane lipoprotein
MGTILTRDVPIVASEEEGGDMIISRNNVLAWFLTIMALMALLLLVGCAHVISKETLKEVDRNATFAQVVKAPDAYIGKTVLFGGAIIETKNFADKSEVVVLQSPLDSRDRPVGGDVSEGRFIVTTQGFLDPAIYSPGRKITVAGKVVGKEKHPMGEIEYTYPVIEKQGLYLWPVAGPASAEPRWQFGFGVGTGGAGVGVGTGF